MTLSLPRFRSLGAIGLALVWTSLTFGAAISPSGAEARSNAPYYSVELASPTAETRAIISDVLWQCQGTKCLAAEASSRPLTICKRVVRELGEVASFTAGNVVLNADELAACNGK